MKNNLFYLVFSYNAAIFSKACYLVACRQNIVRLRPVCYRINQIRVVLGEVHFYDCDTGCITMLKCRAVTTVFCYKLNLRYLTCNEFSQNSISFARI